MAFPSFRGSDDLNAAIQHAGLVKKQPAVRQLLRDIGQPELLRGFGERIDYQLFPGMHPVLTALVRAGADTDDNLRLLFGDPARVQGTVNEIRMYAGAPAGSPAANLYGAPFPTRCHKCAQCGTESPHKKMSKCARCKTTTYCSRDCQKAHWKKHKKVCARIHAEEEGIQEKQRPAAAPLSKKRMSALGTAYGFASGLPAAQKPAFTRDETELRVRILLDFEADELVFAELDGCVPQPAHRSHKLCDLGAASLKAALDAAASDAGWSFEVPVLCIGCRHAEPRRVTLELHLHESNVTEEVTFVGTIAAGTGCLFCGDGDATAPRACRFEELNRRAQYWDERYRFESEHDPNGSWNRRWHDCNGRPFMPAVANPAVLMSHAREAGFTDLSCARTPLFQQPPFDAPELQSCYILELEHVPSGHKVKVYHDRLFANGGDGDYRAERLLTAFVLPPQGAPARKSCTTLAEYDVVLASVIENA